MHLNSWHRSLIMICSLILFITLTGCWDRIELENRETVIGIALDAVPEEKNEEKNKKDNFQLTAQFAIPGRIPLGQVRGDVAGGGGNTQDKVLVSKSLGHTVDHALQNLQNKVVHEIYLGQLQAVVVSEDLAKKGLNQVNEFLRRRPEVRRTLWMAVISDKAEKSMEIGPPLERVPALHITYLFDNNVSMGEFPENNAGEFWQAIANHGQETFLPYIKIMEKDLVQIEGLAYFKDDKFIGKLSADKITYYNTLMGARPGGSTTLISVPGTEGEVMIESISRKAKRRVSLRNGKPHVEITVNISAKIREKSLESIDLSKVETIEKIQRSAEEVLTNGMLAIVQQTQKDGSDIFGFGENVRAKLSAYWDKEITTKKNWQKKYEEITVNIKTNVNIQRIGMKNE